MSRITCFSRMVCVALLAAAVDSPNYEALGADAPTAATETTKSATPASPADPARVTAPAALPAAAASASALLDDATADDGDPFSETLMTSTVSFLNQSYVSIGILADAAGKDVFEGEELAELLDLHHTLAEQVEQQLRALAKAPGLDAADVAAINELVKLAQLNKWQCETLAEIYAGDETKEKVWEQLREAAYKELAKYSDEEPAATSTDARPATTAGAPAATTTK